MAATVYETIPIDTANTTNSSPHTIISRVITPRYVPHASVQQIHSANIRPEFLTMWYFLEKLNPFSAVNASQIVVFPTAESPEMKLYVIISQQ